MELDAAVLYADLVESTILVRDKDPRFAAEIYKAYITMVCRIIKRNDGVVTAFDGDRVMGVFASERSATAAARAAFEISWSGGSIVNRALKEIYATTPYDVRQVVGIDTGKMLVARTGVRGKSDLVWAGLAANRAAKLSGYRGPEKFTTVVSAEVFARMDAGLKTQSNGSAVWTQFAHQDTNAWAYGSSCTCEVKA